MFGFGVETEGRGFAVVAAAAGFDIGSNQSKLVSEREELRG